MWIEFEYKENKYRVRIEHNQEKRFFRKPIDKYYIHIEKDNGFIDAFTKEKVYDYYYYFEFNKYDNIFRLHKNDENFKKQIYFDYTLDYILQIPYEEFKESLINKSKKIIDNVSVYKEKNINLKNRITEI